MYLIDSVDEIARLRELFVFLSEVGQTPSMRCTWFSERGGSMAAKLDGATVLVVDEDRMLADTLAEILRKHGYQPVALYSGEEALELAQRFRPDVVLSDIRMRRLDGIEAATRIRALHPDCRVILFTAHTVSAAMRQTIHELRFELLQRPLRPEDVLTALGVRS
jgi:DNA-binding NtrC family response regulator